MIDEYPAELAKVDFARIRFSLELQGPCMIEPVSTLSFRRALQSAARRLCGQADGKSQQRLRDLLDPQPSFDPVAVKKFQKPAPPFVLKPLSAHRVDLDAGDVIPLEVLFVGHGVTLIDEFCSLLDILGTTGLTEGEGSFEVCLVESLGLTGSVRTLWRENAGIKQLAPEIFSAEAFLAQAEWPKTQITLKFVTPTRLIQSGRLLRQPHFADLLPFMFRRVTSQCHAHAHLELTDDPQQVLGLIHQVHQLSARWEWVDWRGVGHRPLETIGGFSGALVLEGPGLDGLYWIISLASLLGLGKWATYGAGHYQLCPG
jgi:hypothetical protein